MLNKKYRLRNSNAFSATFRVKNFKSNDLLIVYFGNPKQNPAEPTKIGFVVSKKIHKRAVKRNLIKRRLREIYSQAFKSNLFPNIRKPISIVVIAKANSLESNFSELKNSFLDLLSKF